MTVTLQEFLKACSQLPIDGGDGRYRLAFEENIPAHRKLKLREFQLVDFVWIDGAWEVDAGINVNFVRP